MVDHNRKSQQSSPTSRNREKDRSLRYRESQAASSSLLTLAKYWMTMGKYSLELSESRSGIHPYPAPICIIVGISRQGLRHCCTGWKFATPIKRHSSPQIDHFFSSTGQRVARRKVFFFASSPDNTSSL